MSTPSELNPSFETVIAPIIAASSDRESDLRCCQVATIGIDGGPRIRTLILRDTNIATRELVFYTDRRSPKTREIAANSRVSCHFYSATRQTQYRFYGDAELCTDGTEWNAHWCGLKPYAMRDYASDLAPGDTGTAHYLDALAEQNFALILYRFRALDWLNLSRQGHQRCAFTWQGDAFAQTHLVP